MRWNSEERAFAVEAYFSSGCSVIATQRAFRNRFNLAPLAPVPDRKSIVTWVTTFRQTASATKRRTGVPRPVRSPENIEAVRASMLRSPRRSARKHASALRLSDRSVRRILRDDLHFHPYKMAIVQELSEQRQQFEQSGGLISSPSKKFVTLAYDFRNYSIESKKSQRGSAYPDERYQDLSKRYKIIPREVKIPLITKHQVKLTFRRRYRRRHQELTIPIGSSRGAERPKFTHDLYL
ncbi:hypothetical protein ILUMI_12705 [Ignelater luminosus]|uniref:DUF4817 domain-containing protein n=1 Tax=Ignelater luminosus TaxID=2038154 RepID=A0A8K0CXM3_IGNLU|nr:hypothetical protein ILUMI_12705 [Ignelater luminosus]